MSPKPKSPLFSRQISLGNILTVIGMVIALVGGWYGMQARIEAATASISTMERNLIELEGGQKAVMARVRANEIAITRQDERWNQVSQFMARIETTVQRIEQALRTVR